MLKRFSAYGFFKNQRYFEPFLYLYFIEAGLSFTQIGILIAIREALINIAEIPSGALADIYGRRGSMIFAFVSYIISFLIFGFVESFWLLVAAMFFFAIGDAFRTGTHKAMIFTWLRDQNRISEKSKVYGFTRSWSKIGSAVSIVIAVSLLLTGFNYHEIFFFSIIPYILGIINFLAYPQVVDGDRKPKSSVNDIFNHLKESFSDSFKIKGLRRLLIEGMSFEGLFKAIKDYVQPVIKNMAILSPGFLALTTEQQSIVTVGIVYFFIAIFSATASRQSHKVANFAGDEEKGTKVIWYFALVLYLSLIPLVYYELYLYAIIIFVLLNIAQNVFRPLLISRYDNFSDEKKGATILSIESQAKTVATMIFAPVIGFSVDLIKANNLGGDFWSIGLFGAIMSLIIIFTFPKTQTTPSAK